MIKLCSSSFFVKLGSGKAESVTKIVVRSCESSIMNFMLLVKTRLHLLVYCFVR